MAWIPSAVQAGVGLFSAIKGSGKTDAEKEEARRRQKQDMWESSFLQRGSADIGRAESYFAPIAGGSREKAFETMAPELQGAAQRMDMARKSLLDLAPRSGGAAASLDPYAKSDMATNMLMKARPAAAQSLFDIGRNFGSMAGSMGSRSYEQANIGQANREKAGQGFASLLNNLLQQFDWSKLGGKSGSKSGGGWGEKY